MACEDNIKACFERSDMHGVVTEAISCHGSAIFAHLVEVLRDEDIAWDIFQDFCQILWTNIESFKWNSSIKTWMYKLAHTARTRWFRSLEQHAGPLRTREALELAVVVRSSTPRWRRTDFRSEVDKLREQLDPDEREILFLRINEKMPWSDVADVMSTEEKKVTPQSLRKRFQRVKQTLRKQARNQGLC